MGPKRSRVLSSVGVTSSRRSAVVLMRSSAAIFSASNETFLERDSDPGRRGDQPPDGVQKRRSVRRRAAGRTTFWAGVMCAPRTAPISSPILGVFDQRKVWASSWTRYLERVLEVAVVAEAPRRGSRCHSHRVRSGSGGSGLWAACERTRPPRPDNLDRPAVGHAGPSRSVSVHGHRSRRPARRRARCHLWSPPSNAPARSAPRRAAARGGRLRRGRVHNE